MVRRHALQFRHIDAGQQLPEPSRFGGRRAVRSRHQRVACVKHHGAALLHEFGQFGDGNCGRLRLFGGNWPVEQRVEGQFIPRRINADRIARGERGAGVKRAGKRGEAQAAGFIDLLVAGDDIGQPRCQSRI